MDKLKRLVNHVTKVKKKNQSWVKTRV